MQTLSDFLQACKTTSSVDIYDLFYDASNDVREAVFAEAMRLGVVFADENEPTRASMCALGKHYKIQSLIEY